MKYYSTNTTPSTKINNSKVIIIIIIIIVHFYGAIYRASEAPRFSVQRYFEEVSL